MRIIRTTPFREDFKKLPENIKRKAEQSLRFLVTDVHHPSLRVKKIKSAEGIWEVSITRQYRITFEIKGDAVVLRRVGSHNKTLKRP